MIAVSDQVAGNEFYGNKLGLRRSDENPGGAAYKCGTGVVFVYQAPSAGKNEATSATWEVEDIEGVVAELKAKGISFESYNMPHATKEGDVYVMGGMKAAWFKDPDGNTLGLSQMLKQL